MNEQHKCHGCPDHKFGCKKTCESWKQYEAQHMAELEERQRRSDYRHINYTQRGAAIKEYIRDKKLQPRSASNYF